MVGRVCDETFREFVQRYCETGLEAYGEKGVGGDMVVVLLIFCFLIIGCVDGFGV